MDPFTLTQAELITYLTELGIEVSRGVLFMLNPHMPLYFHNYSAILCENYLILLKHAEILF